MTTRHEAGARRRQRLTPGKVRAPPSDVARPRRAAHSSRAPQPCATAAQRRGCCGGPPRDRSRLRAREAAPVRCPDAARQQRSRAATPSHPGGTSVRKRHSRPACEGTAALQVLKPLRLARAPARCRVCAQHQRQRACAEAPPRLNAAGMDDGWDKALLVACLCGSEGEARVALDGGAADVNCRNQEVSPRPAAAAHAAAARLRAARRGLALRARGSAHEQQAKLRERAPRLVAHAHARALRRCSCMC